MHQFVAEIFKSEGSPLFQTRRPVGNDELLEFFEVLRVNQVRNDLDTNLAHGNTVERERPM